MRPLADRKTLRRLVVPYRIRFDETDERNVLRSSTLLAYIQDCAWQHSTAVGLDRAWYSERGVFWVARAIDLHILSEAVPYENLQISTEVTAMRRIWAHRRSEVRDDAGALLATGDTDWVMTNAQGAPSRIPPELAAVFPVAAAFEPLRVDLGAEPADAFRLLQPVRRQDLDAMGHVNNTHYLDYLEEAVDAAGAAGALAATPRRYRLEYLAPAAPGSPPLGSTWPTDEGMAYRLTAADGRPLLRAILGT